MITKPRRPAAMAQARHLAASAHVPEQHQIYRAPEPTAIRAIAEFEPMGGVLIAYPGTVVAPLDRLQQPPTGPRRFGVPDELIIRMQQGGAVHVFVLCLDDDDFAAAVVELEASAERLGLSFDPGLMHQIRWDTDTYWTRDYGPWWGEQPDGRQFIAKHLYTSLGTGAVGDVEGDEHEPPRPRGGIFRPNDDYGADKFSDVLNAPVLAWQAAGKSPPLRPHGWYFLGLLDAGGDYMVNGRGVVASSYLVATQAELPGDDSVDSRMRYITEQLHRFLGVSQYWVLADPSETYIGHIDCWAKFLSPTSVMIARSDDPTIERAYDDIARFFTDQGVDVARVRCQRINILGSHHEPTTAAYVNSLILNDQVYVPLAGPGFEAEDSAALDAYRAAMPGHEVHGIVGKPEEPWFGTDALHCRTHGVPLATVEAWVASGGPAADA